jgi:hypothetical protein
MLYAAIDIHKRTFQAAVLDAENGETSERRFAATREELNDWAMPLQGKLTAVAIEATTRWRWMWRELSALGFDVRLVDPAQAAVFCVRQTRSQPLRPCRARRPLSATSVSASREAEEAAGAEARGVGGKVAAGEAGEEGERFASAVGHRCARADEADRDDAPADKGPVGREPDAQDCAHALGAARLERVVAGEVAEAVGDQAPPVPLHAAEDVGPRAEDEVCSGVDDGVPSCRSNRPVRRHAPAPCARARQAHRQGREGLFPLDARADAHPPVARSPPGRVA